MKKIGKKKLKPLSKLKKELWIVFAKWVKFEYGNTCFTCGSICSGANLHAGHFIKKSIGGLDLYFNENNVRPQCARCNIWLDGNQYEFGQRLGAEIVKELYEIKKKPKPQWGREYYTERIEYYKNIVV